MAVTSRIGDAWFGRSLFGGEFGASLDSVVDRHREHYLLEVEDADGALLYRLPDWVDGDWEEAANEPGALTFVYPSPFPLPGGEGVPTANSIAWPALHSARCAALAYPNVVVLRDRKGNVKGRFHVARVIEEDDGESSSMTVECEGLLTQLRDELVLSYTWTRTVSQHLALLLGSTYQQNGVVQPLSVGDIDSEIGSTEVSVACENQSILQIIGLLSEACGGYYYVTPRRKLNWHRELTGASVELRWEKNLGSIRRERDFRTVRTRLYMRGFGQGSHELRTTVNADNQATYGLRAEVVKDERIRSSTTLTAIGTALQAAVKVPRVYVDCDAIDLGKVSSRHDWTVEGFTLGSEVRVVHGRWGLVSSRRINRIARKLSAPEVPVLGFGDPDAGVADWGGNHIGRPGGLIGTIASALVALEQARTMPGEEVTQTFFPTSLADANDLLGTEAHLGEEWQEGERIAVPDPDSPDPETPDYLDYVWTGEDWAAIGGGGALTQGDITGLGYPTPGNTATVSALNALGSTIPDPGSGGYVQKHMNAANAGSVADYARIDHRHPGRPYYEATTIGNLPNVNIEANAEGYCTSTGMWCDRNLANGNWVSRNVLF